MFEDVFGADPAGYPLGASADINGIAAPVFSTGPQSFLDTLRYGFTRAVDGALAYQGARFSLNQQPTVSVGQSGAAATVSAPAAASKPVDWQALALVAVGVVVLVVLLKKAA